MQSFPKIIIIGGGIGGLSVANALTQAGADWEIHERSQRIGIGGTGLTLWPNALRALARLGLGQTIQSLADPLELGEIYDWRHRLLKSVPLAQVRTRSGLPLLCLRRIDLYAKLLRPLDQSKIHVGSRCTGSERNSDGTTLSFEDGSTRNAPIVVAADGVRSPLRDSLIGFDPLHYVGWMTWRGVAKLPPGTFPKGRYREFFGRGSRFGVFWIRDDYVYWYGTLNSTVHDKPALDPAHQAEALAHFADWPDLARIVISATRPDDLVRTGVYDTQPLPRWTDGSIVLLGDAAHPMTPDLGQGACQAIEDALTLVKCLRDHGDAAAALSAYQDIGLARTSPLVARSRKIGKMRQWQTPLTSGLRNTVMRLMPQSAILKLFET
jgi:2-polyprenyl-6-methoxyphenol hydroxylase-like FAD-dependent oxidoreductase